MAERKKRVVILADTQTHMMPELAREMTRRNHNLVLGDAMDGLAEELTKMGAKVEVVPDTADQTREDTIQKLVDRANDAFGGFDSACIRSGVHGTNTILDATPEDCQIQFEGTYRPVFFALKALLPPLVEQRSGQVVINTSASGLRAAPFVTLYSAMRAGANMLVRNAGLTVAPYGVTVNGMGTYGMYYPAYLHDIGADTDPAKLKAAEDAMPMKRLCKPEEAAYFAASLIDGKGTFQTAQFFPIDGGKCFE